MNEVPFMERSPFQAYSSTHSSHRAPTMNEASTHKSLSKPPHAYSSQDFKIVKEIIQHAYSMHQKDLQRNPQAKIDQIRLLGSYEIVLKQYGIDPMSDGYFYRMLLKLENSKQDLFKALEHEITKSSDLQVADEHHQRCLKAKSFFALVAHMVNTNAESQKGQKGKESRRKAKINKENPSQNKRSARTSSNKENKTNRPFSEASNTQGSRLPRTKSGSKTSQVLKQAQNMALTAQYKRPAAIEIQTGICYTNEDTQPNSSMSESKYNKTSSTAYLPSTQMRCPTMATSQSVHNLGSTQKRDATGFKLLLKCLRSWKKFVQQSKKQKAQEEHDLQNWVVSIHFHEQTLLTKSFLALAKLKKPNLTLEKTSRVLTVVTEMRLRKKYFVKWIRAYKGYFQRRDLVFKALNHWGQNAMRKTFKGWKGVHLGEKHQRFVKLDQILENPTALISLLNLRSSQPLQWHNLTKLESQLTNAMGLKKTECLPYITNAVQKAQLLPIWNHLKSTVLQRKYLEQVAHSLHFRVLLKAWHGVSKRKTNLNNLRESVERHVHQKLVWNYFAQWLNSTTTNMIHRNNKDKCLEYRDRTLKFKVLRGLLEYLGQRQLVQSQMTKSVNQCFNKLLKRTFHGWKFVTVFNKKQRRTMRLGRLIHLNGLKSHYFMLWLTTALNQCRARLHYERRLKSQAMDGLQQHLEILEREMQIGRVCSEHYNHVLLRDTLSQWRKFSAKNRTERHLRRTVFKFIGEFKQRQVLGSWKEVTKELQGLTMRRKLASQKHVTSLKRMAISSLFIIKNYHKETRLKYFELSCYLESKAKSRSLFKWLQAYQSRLDQRKNYALVQEKGLTNRMTHYFVSWYALQKCKREQRTNFFQGRARYLTGTAFTNWKAFTLERSQFRSQLHEFLKLRANNLLRQALGSLFSFTKHHELKRKMRKAAAFIFLEKALRKCFNGFKTVTQRRTSLQKTQVKVQKRLLSEALQKWKIKYLRKDIVKRLSVRQNIQHKLARMKQWQSFVRSQKLCRKIIMIGLQKYGARLLRAGLAGLSNHMAKKQAQKTRESKIYIIYLLKVAKLALLNWKHYSQTKSERKRLSNSLVLKYNLQQKLQAYCVLKHVTSTKRFYRSQSEPYIRNKKRKIMRMCLLSLHHYSLKRSILKVNSEKHTLAKQNALLQASLDGLVRFTQYKRYFREKKALAEHIQQSKAVRKAMYAFMRNKIVKNYTHDLLKQKALRVQHRFLALWISAFNEEQELKPLLNLADHYFMKKQFETFMQRSGQMQVIRMTREHFKRKSLVHYERTQKVRAVKQLFRCSQVLKLHKMKVDLADKIHLRKVFEQWKSNLARLHQGKIDYQRSSSFRYASLISRGFHSWTYTVANQKSQHHRISMIKERQETRMKLIVMHGLLSNIAVQKDLKELILNKIRFTGAKVLRPWFEKWAILKYEIDKERKADTFKIQRGGLYLKQQAFSAFKVGSLKIKKAKLQFRMSGQIYHKKLLSNSYDALKFNAARQKEIKLASSKIQRQQRSSLNKAVFQEMRAFHIHTKAKLKQTLTAKALLQSNLLKKSLLGFSKNHCQSQMCKAIVSRTGISTQFRAMNTWKQSFNRSVALSSTVLIFSQMQEQRLVKQFFQRLVKLSYYQQIYETIQSRRLQTYASTFISLLKRKVIYQHIIAGFTYAKAITSKKQVLQALCLNSQQRYQHRTIIESQLWIAQEESNQELTTTVFNSLKRYVIDKKFKRLALRSYAMTLLKKSIAGLHLGTMRSKLMHHGHQQVQVMLTSKFFWYWLQAMDKSRKEKQALSIMEYNLSNSVFQAWKGWADQERTIRLFRMYKEHQTIKPLAFSAIVSYSLRQKYLAHCVQEIRSNVNFQLCKDVLLNWMEYHNLKKIALKMKKFHEFKLMKAICTEWKAVTDQNNGIRINLVRVKRALAKNPQLKKPLLVLRNFTLFKAFRALVQNTQQQTTYLQDKQTSSYAFYLRLIRKGFYAFKFHLHQKDQRRKVKQLQHLFIQRRWLRFLRHAAQEKKLDRKMRADSAVFNFLNLQRKAFTSLLEYASQSQQYRIKKQFADELYQKRISDKALLAFRLSMEMEDEDQMPQHSANLTRVHEMTLSCSRYEQDLSNLQMECSVVIDMKEKKRLVFELYCKKLLFKCFAGWANLALSISEEESSDEEVENVSVRHQPIIGRYR